mmetsp:Transcript_28747/g.68687  ORF Transcript_28747/g.68687 Transcript_28747/m.68687 type:complete len:216 (+) Transcript_28747:9617-10264(+)
MLEQHLQVQREHVLERALIQHCEHPREQVQDLLLILRAARVVRGIDREAFEPVLEQFGCDQTLMLLHPPHHALPFHVAHAPDHGPHRHDQRLDQLLAVVDLLGDVDHNVAQRPAPERHELQQQRGVVVLVLLPRLAQLLRVLLQRPELAHKRVQNPHQQLAPLHTRLCRRRCRAPHRLVDHARCRLAHFVLVLVVLVVDALDEVHEEADRGGLDG